MAVGSTQCHFFSLLNTQGEFHLQQCTDFNDLYNDTFSVLNGELLTMDVKYLKLNIYPSASIKIIFPSLASLVFFKHVTGHIVQNSSVRVIPCFVKMRNLVGDVGKVAQTVGYY